MNSIRNFVILGALLASCAGLVGCATEPMVPPPRDVFLDSAFAPARQTIDPRAALQLSPAMQRFADSEMAMEVRLKGVRNGLIDALYTKGRLQLDYDSEITRTAAEAFDARRGNCMSLVLMTAAFARHLNVPVYFNDVYVEDQWTRNNGIYFVTGHVNITLGRKLTTGTGLQLIGESDMLTIDFLPPDRVLAKRSRVVDESTILAMFLNNRAAEALLQGQVDDAYWWVREAIATDARWLASYNTLAVLYRRKGLSAQAELVLREVLDREPENLKAMSNLVLVLADQGRSEEAQRYATRLASIQPEPPYKFFDEGVAAMKAGQYATARQLFRKELARAAYVSEFHFWLGLANLGMGDMPAARGELAKAVENSATAKDRELYGAKLAWLNASRERDRDREQQRRRELLRPAGT